MSLPHPIHSAPIGAPGSADVTPHCYVLHRHSQQCSHCGSLHEWSALYVKTHLRTRTGAGKYITNLRACDHLDWNLPIETIPAPLKTIPFCQECVGEPSIAEHLATLAKPNPQPSARDAVISAFQSRDDVGQKTGKKRLSSTDLLELL